MQLGFGGADLITRVTKPRPQCSIDGCVKPESRLGWCRMHLARFERHGSPHHTINDHHSSPEAKFWGRVNVAGEDECWLWTAGCSSEGYGKFIVKGQIYYAHRFSYFLHFGRWADEYVLHSCDTPHCVNPKHLREGSPAENSMDMVARGRHAWGERGGGSKLKASDVATIRQLIVKGVSDAQIARDFGVSSSAIRHIRNGSTWSYTL